MCAPPPKRFTCQSNSWAPPSSSSSLLSSLWPSFLLPSTLWDVSSAFYSSPRHLSLHSVTPSHSPSPRPFHCLFTNTHTRAPLLQSCPVCKMSFPWEIFPLSWTETPDSSLVQHVEGVCDCVVVCLGNEEKCVSVSVCVLSCESSLHSETWNNSWISSCRWVKLFFSSLDQIRNSWRKRAFRRNMLLKMYLC